MGFLVVSDNKNCARRDPPQIAAATAANSAATAFAAFTSFYLQLPYEYSGRYSLDSLYTEHVKKLRW